MRAEIVGITSGKLADGTNLPKLEARSAISNLDDDYEPFGEIDGFQALGITAMPFPANKDGQAEGVCLTDVGNRDGIIAGARDDRCAHVYANLKPGETVVHSTEPEAKSQVRCSPDGQVSVIITDANGDTAALLIDGKNNKFQFAGFGAWFEISEDNGVLISAPGGKASIMMKDDAIILAGVVTLGTSVPAIPPAPGKFLLADTATISAIQALAGPGIVAAANVGGVQTSTGL